MKDAFANVINAMADRIRPCAHEWEVLNRVECGNTYNPNYKWLEFTYRCTKCCEFRIVKTDEER